MDATDELTTGAFERRLPDVPQRQYELFADLVHPTGVSETGTGELDTQAIHGTTLSGDDSAWSETTVRLKPDTTDRMTAATPIAATPIAATPVVSGSSRTVMTGMFDAHVE